MVSVRSKPRRAIRAILAFLVVLVAFATVAIVVLARRESALDPKALLLTTSEWNGGIVAIERSKVDTFNDSIAGLSVDVRRWTMPDSDLVFRQEVERERNSILAYGGFSSKDPGDALREDFERIDSIPVSGASHADQAVGYCVLLDGGCYIVSYWLRYGVHLVQLSLVSRKLTKQSGERLLVALDAAISSKLS